MPHWIQHMSRYRRSRNNWTKWKKLLLIIRHRSSVSAHANVWNLIHCAHKHKIKHDFNVFFFKIFSLVITRQRFAHCNLLDARWFTMSAINFEFISADSVSWLFLSFFFLILYFLLFNSLCKFARWSDDHHHRCHQMHNRIHSQSNRNTFVYDFVGLQIHELSRFAIEWKLNLCICFRADKTNERTASTLV